jgi:hypothetical protein
MHDNSKHVDTYKDYKALRFLDNKWKLVKSLKHATWRQKIGYTFELYGHEILSTSGIEYEGNPIDPFEWLEYDATKSREQRKADFVTNREELEFKFNRYFMKPCHFYRDVLPRFREKAKQWILVVLDKRKCRDIRNLLEYYNILLWDLEDMRRHYLRKFNFIVKGNGKRGGTPLYKVDSTVYSSLHSSSLYTSSLYKRLRLIKTRLRNFFSMCRISNCRVYMLNRRHMNKDAYLSGILRNIFQTRNFMRILT